jgi:hypothetical protein
MVVIVADAILEASRRPGRLNAPDEASCDEDAEGVVHRLERNGTDFGSDDFAHTLGRDVRLARYCSQHSQSLGRDLNTTLTKEVSGIVGHAIG